MQKKDPAKIRLLVASDVHGDPKIMESLAKHAEKHKVDAVVLAGDLSDWDNMGKGMIRPFLERHIEVLFVNGNHDVTAGDVLAAKYNIKNLQFYPVKIKDVGFFGCGAASVGPNFISENDIAGYLKEGYEKIKDARVKVLVTHMRPAGSQIERDFPRLKYSGSEAIADAIAKFHPALNICGHIHEAEDLVEKIGETIVMGTGPRGKIVEL